MTAPVDAEHEVDVYMSATERLGNAPVGAVLEGTVVAPGGASAGGELALADAQLSDTAAALIDRATPAETERAREGDMRRFRAWCDSVRPPRTALQAHPATLASYVGHLAALGRAPSTIARALSSIRVAHRKAGLPVPDTEDALEALRGYRKVRAERGLPNETRASAITVKHLRAMADHLQQTQAVAAAARGQLPELDAAAVQALRDRAALVLGWAMFARRSTLAGLDIADVTETEQGLNVRVRKSKTDKDAQGHTAALPYGANEITCPVRTVRAWLALLAERGITSGPLLRRVDARGRIGGQPGGRLAGRGPADGRLSGQAIGIILARAARASGVADLREIENVRAHGLRAGGVTSAYLGGADLLQLARHGEGWADGSPTLMRYIRDVDRWKHNALTGAGL